MRKLSYTCLKLFQQEKHCSYKNEVSLMFILSTGTSMGLTWRVMVPGDGFDARPLVGFFLASSAMDVAQQLRA